MDNRSGSSPAAESSARLLRIVHVTTTHQAFDTRIFLKECRTLAAAGYPVDLVVPHDHDLVQDGVRIRGIFRPANRWQRWWVTGRQALRAALATQAEVVHLHDPELIPQGWFFKLLGKRVVYDAHENRPMQILSKDWIPRRLRPLVARITRLVEYLSAALFDRVVAATPEIAATFSDRNTVLVQNYPMADELFSAESRPFVERPYHVVFVGGINVIRGAREMVRAMAQVPGELAARLLLVGEFSPASLREVVATEPGWGSVSALGQQSREAVAELLQTSRTGLVLYHPEPNHVGAQPNKLFEYMSAGLPVVASDFPLWRQIVGDADCGLLVDPLDPQAIAEAVTWMLRHPAEAEAMGDRGLQAVRTKLNWDTQAQALLTMYAGLGR